MNKTKIKFYIGRFSPFHKGHAEVLNKARQTSDYVLVLIGSINEARNPKNPWTFEERANIIKEFCDKDPSLAKVDVIGIRDFPYSNPLWIANVNRIISEYITGLGLTFKDVDISITGCDRDSTTFYLKYFPEFGQDLIEENLEVSKFLTATTVREIFFGNTFNGNQIDQGQSDLLISSFLPQETIKFLREFKKTDAYEYVRKEHEQNVNYRKPYIPRPPSGNDPGLPYEVIFQTVDAIVIQTGYVLLIERKASPGKGLLALPGGFVNPRERLFDACIRELREETRLKVPEPVLRSSLVYKDDFDYPDRSLRGRTISKAFLFNLPDFVNKDNVIELPKIKAGDDAKRAMWVRIDDALKMQDKFFEDHYYGFEYLLGKL